MCEGCEASQSHRLRPGGCFIVFFPPDGGLAQAVPAMETKHQGGNLTGPPPLRTIKMGSKENTDILTIKQPHRTDAESHQSSCKIGFQGLSTVLAAGTFFSTRVKNAALDSASDGVESENGKLRETEEECGGGENLSNKCLWFGAGCA